MNDRNSTKETTVYNYRLLRRVRNRAVYSYVYLGLPVAVWALDIYKTDLFRLPVCLLSIVLLHHLLVRILFKMKEERASKLWSVHMRLPWVGLAPDQYYSLSKFKQVNLQLFWVPLLLISCIYPWVSASTLLHLIAAHVWLLAPRFLMFYWFRKHTKVGLIKINPQDTSCYMQ